MIPDERKIKEYDIFSEETRKQNMIIGKYWEGFSVWGKFSIVWGKWQRLKEKHARLRDALEEIAKRDGPYKMDQLEHAGSVIENMGSIADKALKETE